MNTLLRIIFVSLFSLSSIQFVQAADTTLVQKDASAKSQANLKLVVDFYNQFFNDHNVAVANTVVAENYKQHNPFVPDGRAPFVNYFTKVFKDNPERRTQIVRAAVNGDIVFLHVHMTQNPQDQRGRAGVDIFRVENGKIVEHWDVNQDVPEKPANNNTMF